MGLKREEKECQEYWNETVNYIRIKCASIDLNDKENRELFAFSTIIFYVHIQRIVNSTENCNCSLCLVVYHIWCGDTKWIKLRDY